MLFLFEAEETKEKKIYKVYLKQFGTVTIDRTYDVPYIAGASTDSKTIYIDKSIPVFLDIGGKSVDIAKYIAIHELTEKVLMDKGDLYSPAHKKATEEEKLEVEKDDINWKLYQNAVLGFFNKTKSKKNINPPPDLYLNPYIDEKDFSMLKKIRGIT